MAGRTVIDGECLVWTGETSNDGYPRQRLGVFWMVHRWVWINAHHDIPEGMQIDHICNRRACVELAHLRCVTPTENAFAGHSNTPAAINARKTHCIRGHPFEGENLVIEATGKGVARVCRRCRNDRKARARAARRALALAGALRG